MSEQYLVSARKYRPSTFKSVVGQKALTTTLKNAIDSQRLAQAYLFCGPRGVGKTSCARIFAKTINCLNPTPEGEACNECESCRAFNQGRSINVVELDAASNNSVDNIRTLNEQVRIPPQIGRWRVFIIDEVHMLSVAAFNAFLKTLEEPPSYVIFILATTEKHKVIPTILSRCQIYDFSRITVADISEHLKYVASQENISAESSALDIIARKADGAMRDALSIFDQVAASSGGEITYQKTIASLNVLDYDYYFRLIDAFLKEDVPGALLIYKQVLDAGFDSPSFIAGLSQHVRDLLVALTPDTLSMLEVSEEIASKYREQASKLKPQWVYAAMTILGECETAYRVTMSKQFLVELTLIKLCQIVNPKTATKKAAALSPAPLRQPAAASTPAPSAPASATAPTPSTPAASGTPTAPTTTTERTHSPRLRSKLSPVTSAGKPKIININSRPSQQPTETQAPASSATYQGQETHITPEQLSEAWKEFVPTVTGRHTLHAAVSINTPEATEDPAIFMLGVQNPAQVNEVENALGEIIEYLRSRYGDITIKIKPYVDAQKEVKTLLTPRELYMNTLKENPAVSALLEDFEGEFIS